MKSPPPPPSTASGSGGDRAAGKCVPIHLAGCLLLVVSAFVHPVLFSCLLLDQLDSFHNSFLFPLLAYLLYLFLLSSDCSRVCNTQLSVTTGFPSITLYVVYEPYDVCLRVVTPIVGAGVDIHFTSTYIIDPRYIMTFFFLLQTIIF